MSSNIATPLARLGTDSSVPPRFADAIRPTAIALLLAALSLTAGCGSGGEDASGSAGAGASTGAGAGGGAAASFGGTPATTAEIPSGAAFSCDFASTFADCGFGEQAKVAGRATMVNVAGVNAVHLHTEPGDNNVNGSGAHERNDLSLSQAMSDGYEGKEGWWAHSVRFPDDYVDPPISVATWNFGLVADFHNTNSGGGQANFQVQAMPTDAISPDRPTGLSFSMAYGDQTSFGTTIYPIGPVLKNVWYNFVYHVKWSTGSDGFFDAWVNGVQKMTYRGPTLYPGQGVYFKLANYHTAFGQPSSVIHARAIRSNTPLEVTAGL
jgi:hypothetical protein